MPQISRLAKTAMIAGAVGIIAMGCDDSRRADRRVRETVQQARLVRLEEDGAKKAQTLLDQAAKESEAGDATKAHVKSLLGQALLDAANQKISNPDDGVVRGNREIARLLWEIGQLAQQMEGSNTLVASYAQLEPKEAKAAAATLAAAATGAPDKPVWVGENATAIPTMAAAQQKVAQLQDEIARQQQAIAELQKQRDSAAQDAAELQRQSEAQKGKQSLEPFRGASTARKKAADTQNQIDVESSKLARMQQDLALAQAQLAAVTTARDQFQKIAQGLDTAWTGVQQQIEKQKAQAAEILSGQGAASIAGKAAELAKQSAKTQEAYDIAEKNLNDAINAFQAAATDAGKLSGEMRTAASATQSEQLKKAMDQLVAIYNPNVFKLAQANATLALANLQASKAQLLAERAALLEKLRGVVQQAGLTVPKELDDPKLAEDLKAATAAADEQFGKAQELYDGAAQGTGGTESDRNAGRAGSIYALYGKALLARATGNAKAAEESLTLAKSQRDAVFQESKNALAALPAELIVIGPVAPAATAPATTEGATTAPTTEGAATAPATEGAATAPATEGATTTPATETAPAAPAPQ